MLLGIAEEEFITSMWESMGEAGASGRVRSGQGQIELFHVGRGERERVERRGPATAVRRPKGALG